MSRAASSKLGAWTSSSSLMSSLDASLADTYFVVAAVAAAAVAAAMGEGLSGCVWCVLCVVGGGKKSQWPDRLIFC